MTNKELYQKAAQYIPSGTQLLSKRPEMFSPDKMPIYAKSAKGIEIIDIENKKYLDFSYMGIGACILGYANPKVNNAVKNAINEGQMTTINSKYEPELAEILCDRFKKPLVRFARTGGEAMEIAVRIARAKTRKSIVLFDGYHGWKDWYLSANLENRDNLNNHLRKNLEPLGVPKELQNTAIPFNHNNINDLMDKIAKYKDNLACIVIEPIRYEYLSYPMIQYLNSLDIPIIADEITCGFRFEKYSVSNKIGLKANMIVLGKALGNGFPISAVVGDDIMDFAQDTFISSTFWTESVGFAAAIATIQEIDKRHNQDLWDIGQSVSEIWLNNIKDIEIYGKSPLINFKYFYESDINKTFFIECMLDNGILGNLSFYPSYAHTIDDIKTYKKTVKKVVKTMRNTQFKGTVCHTKVLKTGNRG